MNFYHMSKGNFERTELRVMFELYADELNIIDLENACDTHAVYDTDVTNILFDLWIKKHEAEMLSCELTHNLLEAMLILNTSAKKTYALKCSINKNNLMQCHI